MSVHYVYRCYDADGDLIYIGCAANVKRRMTSHRASRAKASRLLAAFVVRVEVSEPFPTKAEALAAEREAIRLERPVFNTQEQDGGHWTMRGATATYLVERGRRDLAVELACRCWRETREAGERDSWCIAHDGTDLPVAAA